MFHSVLMYNENLKKVESRISVAIERKAIVNCVSTVCDGVRGNVCLKKGEH